MPVFSEDKNLAKKENSEGPTTDFKQPVKHPKILLICGLFFCLFSCGVESCFHRWPKNFWVEEKLFRGAAKKKNRFFLGDLSQMWVGGVADSQTRSKPFKTPPNCPENRLFRPKFHLSFSQISQKPWGGWVGKQNWERSPKKKRVFFLAASLI